MNSSTQTQQLILSVEPDLLPTLNAECLKIPGVDCRIDGELIKVLINGESIQNLVWALCENIPRNRWESIRYCLLEKGQELDAQTLMRAQNLEQLKCRVDADWLEEVIREKRLVTYYQPIIQNKPPFRVAAYECLIRGKSKEQEIIAPLRLFSAARGVGLLQQLDHAARINSIENASKVGEGVNIFINFNPKSVSDSLDDLVETMEAVIESGVSPSRFVFEVVESEKIEDFGKLADITECCRKIGCRVALDDVGAGYNSLNILPTVRPDFIKIDMELVRDVNIDPYKGQVAGKLLELARDLRLESIMEGIESVEVWDWVKQNGADFSQGFLFAKPAAVPPILDIQSDHRAATDNPILAGDQNIARQNDLASVETSNQEQLAILPDDMPGGATGIQTQQISQF